MLAPAAIDGEGQEAAKNENERNQARIAQKPGGIVLDADDGDDRAPVVGYCDEQIDDERQDGENDEIARANSGQSCHRA
jgi:hypothetical protein